MARFVAVADLMSRPWICTSLLYVVSVPSATRSHNSRVNWQGALVVAEIAVLACFVTKKLVLMAMKSSTTRIMKYLRCLKPKTVTVRTVRHRERL